MRTFTRRSTRRQESGQVMVFVLLGLGLFLIGAMAFAVDMSNLWFNRQSAQSAADAACTAGAMDMLVDYTNGITNQGGFSVTGSGGNPPAAVDCSVTANQTTSPCKYAALNGFDSAISQTNANNGTLGNNVTFQISSTAPAGLPAASVPPSSVAANAFLSVKITDNIPTFFAGLLRGTTQQNIGATAICGVIQATSPIPILVLHPTLQQAFSVQGNPNIAIVGGPSKSIQVNSCSTSGGASPCQTNVAANVGGSATLNLCAGGATYCGSSMGVWGSESVPGGFITSCAGNRPAGAPSCSGTQATPQWNSPSAPIADPLASLSAPDPPSFNGLVTPNVPAGTNGCPFAVGSGKTCTEYGPGKYPGGIDVSNQTAIFDPGIYYIGGNAATSRKCNNSGSSGSFCSGPNSCIRPSTATGDGSGGTIFYFADSNSVNVGANAGCGSGELAFNTSSGSGSLAHGVLCTAPNGSGLPAIPANLPGTLSGSVLLAPCQKATVAAKCASTGTTANANCNLNFGDPKGTNDPIGEQRGVLFFQDRAVNASNNPAWSGGGSNLLAGTMYFHQCVTTAPDTGQGCVSTAFNDQMNLFGNSGASTYVLGDIIVDQLNLGGGGSIVMDLNPSTTSSTLKASLLQ